MNARGTGEREVNFQQNLYQRYALSLETGWIAMKSRYAAVAWGKLELRFWQFFERLKKLYKSSKNIIPRTQILRVK